MHTSGRNYLQLMLIVVIYGGLIVFSVLQKAYRLNFMPMIFDSAALSGELS